MIGSACLNLLLMSGILIFLIWCRGKFAQKSHSYSAVVEVINLDESEDINLDPEDKHNVHNAMIIEELHEKLLKVIDQIEAMPKNVNEITQYYKANYSGGGKLFHVINFIKNADALYSPSKISELQILNWVFRRAKQHGKMSMQMLEDQLNDCYNKEEGDVRCLEGRVVRYFQALIPIGEFQGVPLWYYKNEIENYCAKRLEAEIDLMNPVQRQRYLSSDRNKLSTWEIKWIKKNEDRIIATIDHHLKNEYLEKLGQKRFNEITQPCYQAIKF